MNESTEQLIMVLDTTANRKVKTKVEQLIFSGCCLACKETASTRRGLCSRCYSQWQRARSGMTRTKAATYDCGLIRRGLLLAAQGCRKLRNVNVFRRASGA
jgi:hypothetical protein